MRALPRLLTTVDVPPFLSPSALGSWGGCVLKLVSATRGAVQVELLGASPTLSIGTFAHRVISQFERSTNTTATEVFDSEYQRLQDELSRDPMKAHFADLVSTKTMAEWARLKAWILSRCERLERSGASRATGSLRTSGSELALESGDLRLRGSADRVRRVGRNDFEVRDFKSGSVFDDDGTIKLEIRLQLLAYGLMVAAAYPRASIRLIVDDGFEHEVAFDAQARSDARREIDAITGSVPASGPADADQLASPGPGCWGCAVRHVCKSYRASAPVWWREYPDNLQTVSKDVWGTISEIRSVSPTGHVELVVMDDGGRHVRIDRLDVRHGLGGETSGTRVWMFDLESSGGGRDFDGHRFHPRAFHEHPRDRRDRRAWRLRVYRGP